MTRSRSIESASQQWARLRPEFVAREVIGIPDEQFRYDRAVADELRFRYVGGQLTSPQQVWPSRPGAVIVILESPHQWEYTSDYQPLGPLQKPASKTRLRNQLPRLIQEAGGIEDADIVLCNPIQFQTSLHRLMLPGQPGVQSTVRDAVWKALYSAHHNGVRVFEQHFIERIRMYDPDLVINACTAGVKAMVTETLDGLPYRVCGVSQHPSYWGSHTHLRAT